VSISVICTGCGKNLEVGDDYLRKKLRCPECGVIFDLPALGKKEAPRPVRSQAGESLSQERVSELVGVQTAVARPAAPNVLSAAPPTAITAEPEPSSRIEPAAPAGASAESPIPGAIQTFPAHKEGTKEKEEMADEEERCPVCNELLPLQASHCPICGFLLPVGKKVFKVNQPLERHWEAGLPFGKRLTLFLVCQFTVLMAMIAGSLAGVNPLYFLFPWLIFTGMTAFLFGSWVRIDLTRSKRGKVRLKQTWRIGFWSRAPVSHRLGDYEDLATGVANDFSDTDKIILVCLIISAVMPVLSLAFGFSLETLITLIPGFVPPVVWWYCAFYRDNYFVALCRDHGFPAIMLYRGWSEAHAEDMAKTICEVTGLPRRKI
jgi:hypothetical protein